VLAVCLNAGYPTCGIWFLKRTFGSKQRKRSSVKNSNLTHLHLPSYRPALSMLVFFRVPRKKKEKKTENKTGTTTGNR